MGRRTALKGAAATAGALAFTFSSRSFDAEAAAAPAHKGVFGYGVASGDPTGTAVVIWTRVTPPRKSPKDAVATPGSGLGERTHVTWELAYDRHFHRIAEHGSCFTHPDSDHTVKVDVTGLHPYTQYFYRFKAAGETSPVGRTRTAPDVPGRAHALRFALVTCSNYTGGYFTAYRQIAARDDLDFVLHLGDYIYEYPNGPVSDGSHPDGRYGPAALVGVRDAEPANALLTLTDYRLRHAIHKADPDARAAHLAHPWITIFDDHEVANNAWDSGAENQPAGTTAAQFQERRRAAYRAYLEWMPFRLPEQSQRVPHRGTRFFRRFTFGTLGSLSILETRQNRSRQVDFPGFTTAGGGFVPTALPGLTERTDAALADPSRHLPEPEQLAWLKEGLKADDGWHLIGNQVVQAPVRFPAAALAPSAIKSNGGPLPDSTLLVNSDQWDGYQADQAAITAAYAASPGDVVVLTGDIHSSWATEIPSTAAATAPGTTAYTSAAVEFVTPSVTSDGFYEQVAPMLQARNPAVTPEQVVATVKQLIASSRQVNPWVRYLDGVGHGFSVLDVTEERVQADFYLTPVPTTAQPDPRVVPAAVPTYSTSWVTAKGTRTLSRTDTPVGPRADNPA
ncbi:alkaline phosphatase D [Streptomyces sp. TLI_171]|nr:alkaline phosphatase D [Streptomyces sp. TLI_171]